MFSGVIVVITDFRGALKKQIEWNEMLSNYEKQYIWDEEVPGFDEDLGQDKPSIVFFKSENSQKDHGCVLIFAGGYYLYKAVSEAEDVAKKFNSAGIDAAILDYRTAPYVRDTMAIDAKRALKYLRYNANKLGFNPEKIAVAGFSAGGNLAVLSAINSDDGDKGSTDPVEQMSSRPNALILCYAAVNIVEEYQKDEDFSLISYFDVVIDKEKDCFPPTFIWHSMSDKLISYRVAMEFASTLNSMDVPVEMHLFPYGVHGQGLAEVSETQEEERDNKLTSCWSDLCIRWLDFYGFLS